MINEGSRMCPQCAEEIRVEAVKCKHCGNFVAGEDWRRFAQHWAYMSQNERDRKWRELSEAQRRALRAVWDALGYGVRSDQPIVLQQGRSGCWWVFIIAMGIIAGILIASLL